MNIYKKKRQKINMSEVDMAKKLGMDLVKYKFVEKGLMKMPKELIDKFNKIIDDGAINKIDVLEHKKEVERWFEENFLDKNKLKDILKFYNIENYKHLGIVLGYKDGSTITRALKDGTNTKYTLKNKIYTFLTNEMNIQLPINAQNTRKKQKTKTTATTSPERSELLEWFNNFDLKQFASENNFNPAELSRKLGISSSTAWGLLNTQSKSGPNTGTLKKLKSLVENQSGLDELSKEFPKIPEMKEEDDLCELTIQCLDDEPIVETTKTKYTISNTIDKYKKIIYDIDNKLNDLQKDMSELETNKKIYSEVLKELELIEDEQ